MLNLLKTHAPTILEGCRDSLAEVTEDLGFRVLNGAYSSVPAISLDYAVAEKADNLMCVPLTTSWSDIGSWSSVWDFMDKDPSGNVLAGSGEIIIEDARDCFALSDHGCVALVKNWSWWRCKTLSSSPPRTTLSVSSAWLSV